MTKTTLDNRLYAAISALTAARTALASKSDYEIANLGENPEIRVSGGTVLATADGEVAYIPDAAMTDSVHFSEGIKRYSGYMTNASGAQCPTCGGSGRI